MKEATCGRQDDGGEGRGKMKERADNGKGQEEMTEKVSVHASEVQRKYTICISQRVQEVLTRLFSDKTIQNLRGEKN